MSKEKPKKLYCYVDETGQDAGSEIFVVVAVVSEQDQEALRRELIAVEYDAKTGHRKWHKSRAERRLKYIQIILERKIAKGDVYFGSYQKPLPYFLPILDVLEKAIKEKTNNEKYKAIVYIDGIDRKKAAEITNALRIRGISLELVKSRRDESEPIIRLADMWAGCVRAAISNGGDEKVILDRAKKAEYAYEIAKTKIPLKEERDIRISRLFPINRNQSLPKGQAFTEIFNFKYIKSLNLVNSLKIMNQTTNTNPVVDFGFSFSLQAKMRLSQSQNSLRGKVESKEGINFKFPVLNLWIPDVDRF